MAEGIASSRNRRRSVASELAAGTTAAAVLLPVERLAERLRRLHQGHEPRLGEPPSELELMIVDGFAEITSAGNDDRALPVGQRDHDRADAGVRDDARALRGSSRPSLEGEEVDAARPGGPTGDE